jgi:hypothetical protein
VKPIRERVKDHLPAVLLTLLSIVQALALELLWSLLKQLDVLYEPTWLAATLWAQIIANFSGIVLVWVTYVSTVMRFEWLPTIGDSVYPLLIGVGEFILIETTRPGFLGVWFLQMALIFAVMNWVSHHSMRRARAEEENAWFFQNLGQATFRDFYPATVVVIGLGGCGICFVAFETPPFVSLAAVLIVNLLMIWQLYSAKRFWDRTFIDRSG